MALEDLVKLLPRNAQTIDSLTLDQIGLELSIDQSSAKHDFLRHYEAELTQIEPRVIAIIAAQGGTALATCLARFLPSSQVLLYSLLSIGETGLNTPANMTIVECGNLDRAIGLVRRQRQIDVLIEDGTNKKSQKLKTFVELFWHLAPRGLYACEDLHAVGLPALVDRGGEDILDYVNRLTSLRRMPSTAKADASVRDRQLAAAMGRVTNYGRLLMIEKQGQHLLKSVEGCDSLAFLADRGSSWMTDRILMPAGQYRPRGTVTTNRPDLTSERFPESILHPDIHIRTYQEVGYAQRQVLHKDGLLLPDTYRRFPRKYATNPQAPDCTKDYAVLRDDQRPKNRLRGTYYYLDSEYPHKYGHFISEMIARLHGWRVARKEHPDIKLLLSSGPNSEPTWLSVKPWVREILGAYGISESDVHVQNAPAVIDEVIAATPLYSNSGFIHPHIMETWRELRDELAKRSTIEVPERVFITRGVDLARICRNQAEVEAEFEKAGFLVIRPETLPMSDQVALFAKAREIAGFGGSGMINLLFSTHVERTLVISPETYNAINEYLITSVLGIDMTYLYCGAELAHPTGGWSEPAFRSPFTVDFQAEGHLIHDFVASTAGTSTRQFWKSRTTNA